MYLFNCYKRFVVLYTIFYRKIFKQNLLDKMYIKSYICNVKNNKKGIVTIISDDGDFETGINLNFLCKKYNIEMTVAGVVRRIEEHLKEWKDIISEKNIELISHSLTHKKISNENKISKRKLYKEIIAPLKFFNLNFGSCEYCYVPPYNSLSDEAVALLHKSGVVAIRRGPSGVNSLSPMDGTALGEWLNLYSQGIGYVHTTDERNQWIDNVINDRKWIIEMWHDVTELRNHGSFQEITIQEASDHLKYIQEKSSEIWVAHFTKAVAYLQERQNYELLIKSCKGRLLVSLVKKGGISKAVERMNYPLTIAVNVDGDNIKCVTVNNVDVDYVVDDEYIYFDMRPKDVAVVEMK